MRANPIPWIAAAVSLAAFACGGATLGEPGGPPVEKKDSGVTSDAEVGPTNPGPPTGQPVPGSVVGPCGVGDSCPADSTCYYPIGSCTASPVCVVDPAPGTPECGAEEVLCPCNDLQTTPITGCGFPTGFASGPNSGNCGNPTPIEPIDAGSPLPETPDGGVDMGPCGSGGDCPSGTSCYYPIGECGSPGECFSPQTGPECGAEESLCGCDGSEVVTGCGFPSGYASGPTDGSGSCGGVPVEDAGQGQGFDSGQGQGGHGGQGQG